MRSGDRIRAAEWLLLPQMTHPTPGDAWPKCPDCGQQLSAAPLNIEIVAGAAITAEPPDPPPQSTPH